MQQPDLPPALAQALAARGYDTLTEVQTATAAPEAVGRDLIVSARTGSGKTVAFGLAMASDLIGENDKLPFALAPLGLVIAPITSTALHWVRGDEAGLAAALVNTARMLGAVLGLAILSAWGLELFKSLMTPYPITDYLNKQDEYQKLVQLAGLRVYTTGFLTAAGLCALAILPALGLRRPAPALPSAIVPQAEHTESVTYEV